MAETPFHNLQSIYMHVYVDLWNVGTVTSTDRHRIISASYRRPAKFLLSGFTHTNTRVGNGKGSFPIHFISFQLTLGVVVVVGDGYALFPFSLLLSVKCS